MSSEQLKNHLKRNCLGRKNAVKSPELEQALRISGNELRHQVNRLRRKKVPICSGPEGYFYAGNAGEIYATIRSLEVMARGLEHAVEGLEAALESFGEHPGEIYATIHSLEIMAQGLEHAVEGLEAALESFGEHPGGDAP